MHSTKIQVIAEAIDLEKFDDKKLPSDTHLITFTKEGKEQVDAVRAYTMVDIFDAYYTKLGKSNPIHSIKSGYGQIRPHLYGKIKGNNES
jgi:hypothetical protein